MLHFLLAEWYFENKLFFVNIHPELFESNEEGSLKGIDFCNSDMRDELISKLEPGFK